MPYTLGLFWCGSFFIFDPFKVCRVTKFPWPVFKWWSCTSAFPHTVIRSLMSILPGVLIWCQRFQREPDLYALNCGLVLGSCLHAVGHSSKWDGLYRILFIDLFSYLFIDSICFPCRLCSCFKSSSDIVFLAVLLGLFCVFTGRSVRFLHQLHNVMALWRLPL